MKYLLIGQPNVGKSSIYNILVGFNSNIIHSESGTTRDWHYDYIIQSSSIIYDAPGIIINQKNKTNIINKSFNNLLKNKIDIFLYVVDYKLGYNNIDNFSISNLRNFNKPIYLIINKFDNFKKTPSNDFLKYGINNNFYISCSHKFGFDILSNIFLNTNHLIKKNDIYNDFSIAIFGKPNAGKSTFLNSILGYKRSLISPNAGTTTDFVEEKFYYKKKCFKIIDTAGIGRKSNIKNNSINDYSIRKSFNNITTVDASIIIVNSVEGLDRQDKRIIQMITNKAKSIILVFNKIDLIDDVKIYRQQILNLIDSKFKEIKNIKIFFISSLKKNHVIKIIEYLYKSVLTNDIKISTSQLNRWLKTTTIVNSHPMIESKKINFKYAVQVKNKPITIKIYCSYASRIKDNYKRYLINNFNNNFKIFNQKTKFVFSSSKNPYI